MSLIEYQRTILGDAVRNRAFFGAMKKLIVPGETTVADIGAGTGYLSFLARSLGAKECHLYEVSELSDVSRALAKENGITGCRFVHQHSMDVKNPPKVDLVISETFGNFALEESIIGNLNDAKRFLKPGGTVMPSGLRQFVAPVITDRIQKGIDTWADIEGDLQWKSAREVGLNNMYVQEVRPEDLLKESVREWDSIDCTKTTDEKRHSTVNWANHESPITIHGFCLWWEASLVPGIILSISPFEPPTHWQHIYLPLLEPLHLNRSEMLELRLDVDSRYDVRINVAWDTVVKNAQGIAKKHLSQDMRKGFLS